VGLGQRGDILGLDLIRATPLVWQPDLIDVAQSSRSGLGYLSSLARTHATVMTGCMMLSLERHEIAQELGVIALFVGLSVALLVCRSRPYCEPNRRRGSRTG